MAEWTLWLHGKQGDDFNNLLDATKGDVPKAFRLWAEAFEQHKTACLKIAQALEGHVVDVTADTHMIAIAAKGKGSARPLVALQTAGLLEKMEES